MQRLSNPKIPQSPICLAVQTSRLARMQVRVRSLALTEEGYLSCLFDGGAGKGRALSDAPMVHLPELRKGDGCEVALLRLSRVIQGNTFEWQLLSCRSDGSASAGAKASTVQGERV